MVQSMGRILGLDFGLRRVGGAISDPCRTFASPLEVYTRGQADREARHYLHLVAELDVEQIVIGLPVHTSGRESEMASRARAWGAWLASITGLPVTFVDERYTSVEAENIMIKSGLKRQRRREMRDKLAAQILLQSYLDAGCPKEAPTCLPLADGDSSGR
jgi:putative Holliday junction resolvase